ncbi:hypothetical protein ACE38V_18380 [Cytobacillus sp. Hz8]|uniref:hypothetical protein n=1 Tax=Cytobacillus sp. Hz8 TaxID=3347168 RepID=UPI0035DADB7F
MDCFCESGETNDLKIEGDARETRFGAIDAVVIWTLKTFLYQMNEKMNCLLG